MSESWSSGTAYERFMGRWSALVGRKFLGWLDAGPSRTWLDVGCGTGALTRLILETQKPARVTSIDSSADFIAHAQRSITDPAVQFRVGLAQSLELEAGAVDAAVSGLVLNFVPQPRAAVAEMARVTKPGGTVGIFIWDYADGMQMLRYFWDAVVALDPRARELDEGVRFPLCAEGRLESLVRESGLKQIEAGPIEVETVFRDFDDYWQPFLGGAGPASSYVLSLDQGDRKRLEEKLLRSLPFESDGSLPLVARAWSAKGTA